MYFAKWETKEEMIKDVPLKAVNGKTKITKSGIPMAYDDEFLYVNEKEGHSLVIGSTGSGKTQAITLPLFELAKRAGESVVVHDTKNELYEKTNEGFKESGYNVIRLNFDDARNCNCWNPFELPYRLYLEGNKDKSQDLLEELGYYLLSDSDDTNMDPYWINSAIDYFTGLVLYMFDNEEEIGFDTLRKIDDMFKNNLDEFKNKIDKNSKAYLSLSGILNVPFETSSGIISTFNQRIKRFISKENLNNILNKTDFDIAKISSDKTIIYIVSGNSSNSERLMPLLISQIYYAKDEYAKNDGNIKMILDEFYAFYPIKNFMKILDYSRGLGINFTVMIRGFNEIKNKYNAEQTEIIKMCFGNIVYLLSQDIKTLEEISDLCGKTCVDGVVKPLVSVEELKTLKTFEAIILVVRVMPFRTKLLPYYEIEKSL